MKREYVRKSIMFAGFVAVAFYLTIHSTPLQSQTNDPTGSKEENATSSTVLQSAAAPYQCIPFFEGRPFDLPDVTPAENAGALLTLVVRGMEHNLSLLNSFRVYTRWLVWQGLSVPEGNAPRLENLEKVAPGRKVVAFLPRRSADQAMLAVDGERFRYEKRVVLPAFAPKNSQPYTILSFDGLYMSTYDSVSGFGSVNRSPERDLMLGMLWSLGLAYQSADLLPNFLRNRKVRVVGTSAVRGEPCVVLDVADPNHMTLRFWIAHKKGCLPRLIRCDGPKLTDGSGLYSARLYEFGDYRSFDNGAWLPTRYAFTSYRVMRDGRWKLNIKEVAVVQFAEVGLSFSEGYFQIHFPLGTSVYDAVAEEVRTIGGNNKDLVARFDEYAQSSP